MKDCERRLFKPLLYRGFRRLKLKESFGMKMLNCDIMFCKNTTDDYHCCVQWSESPLTAYDDSAVPSFKRYHHISKSELRDIFNHLRQFDTLLEIKVSRYKYSRFKMRKVRYVYVLS